MSLRRIAESGSYAIDLEADDATGEIAAFVLHNLTKAAIDVRVEIAGQEIAKARVEPDKPHHTDVGSDGVPISDGDQANRVGSTRGR